MLSKLASNKNVRDYFTSDAWTALSEYEKRRYENVQKNYEILQSSGISSKMPEFMMSKFKRPMPKSNQISDKQTKGFLEQKAKFKLFGIAKQPISKPKKSKKAFSDVSSDFPIVVETETPRKITPPTETKMITTMINLRGVKPKEFAQNLLSSAQDALKMVEDMLRDMGVSEEEIDSIDEDFALFDEEVDLSKPGYSKVGMKDYEKKIPIFDRKVNSPRSDSSKVFMKEYKREVPIFDEKLNLSEPDSSMVITKGKKKKIGIFDEKLNLSKPGSSNAVQQKPRYPKRKVAKKSYKEEDLSSDDEFLFCDDCNEEHKGPCPVHGPMLLVCDTKVPKGDTDKAKKTLPHFLSLGTSSIPKAGLGVWTEVPLVAGVVFGPYEGCVIKKREDAKKSGYAWEVRKQLKPSHYVEGANKDSANWMRYVNCANQEEWQNVIAFQYFGKIFYRTYKPILPFTEILVWYGNDYGSVLSKQLKEKKCVELPKEITGFACDVCHSLFSSSEMMTRHRKQHLSKQRDGRHRCTECSYSTDNTQHLRNHLLTHSGEKLHACLHCSKRFTRVDYLRTHLLLHSEEKEHVCGTCGKRFTQKGNLVSHERVHSGEKPYRCPDCGKDFNQACSLKKHLRLHTRQRPYPCPHCEYRSTRSDTLTEHIASRHTRMFPLHCSLCGKGFCRPVQLKNHVEREHGEKGH